MASDNTSAQHQGSPACTYHPEVHHDIFPTGRFFINWLMTGITGILLLILSITAIYIVRPELKEGDVIDRAIFSPYDATVEDTQATRKARERVKQGTVPVFVLDTSQDAETLKEVNDSLAIIEDLIRAGLNQDALRVQADRPPPSGRGTSRTAHVQAPEQHLSISAGDAVKQLTASDQDFENWLQSPGVKVEITNLLKEKRRVWGKLKATHPTVAEEHLAIALSLKESEKENFDQSMTASTKRLLAVYKRLPQEDSKQWQGVIVEFLPDSWSQSLRANASTLIARAVQANLAIDAKATQERENDSAAGIAPITRKIAEGQLIVPKGSRLTGDDIELLKSVGITQTNRWPMVLALCLSIAAAVALSAGFLYTFEPRHLFQTTSIGLMYTVAIVVCAAASVTGKTFPQFIPLPAAALVWTIFFGRRVALALTLPAIIVLAVSQIVDLRHLIALGTASGAAIGGYTKQRNSLMLTGIVIGAMQSLGFVIASVITGSVDSWTSLGRSAGLELFAGVVSAMLAIGSLPFLESIFGMVTPFRLAEITDADQPLLRQLEEKAPGTYQHSLAVANLAEGGARAIGADVNLVRAGALYHDIGKMARPKYFIENQLGAKNPHDSMQPEESRERVLAHVTDGIDLARKHRLPRVVQDFIPMHQGTSLMAYFYHKACVRDGVENVDPLFYRYPGPKPQSKETAIVMLADVSEAVTHSMHDPTEEEVETAIGKVFQNRWDDGQFNEAGLTYEELMTVKSAFVRVWRTLHHERLRYPSTTTGRMAIPPQMPSDEPEGAGLKSADETSGAVKKSG